MKKGLLYDVFCLVIIPQHAPGYPVKVAVMPPDERAERIRVALSRMFEQRPLEPGCGYTEERAVDWLAWLAGRLRDRDQTQFHFDRLDDSWLPTPA